MQTNSPRVVVLGTGGTIAGTASSPEETLRYQAAQLTAADLLAAVPALAGQPLEVHQVAQVDSKDMSHALWQHLALTVAQHLQRPEVCGIVITHGTDTLEETAWFLQRVLMPTKPVVLTAAMRPATALDADGPQNLLDAVTLAGASFDPGVWVVMAGRVHSAAGVRKLHGHAVDAFSSGAAGPVATLQHGQIQLLGTRHGGGRGDLPVHPEGAVRRLDRCLSVPSERWPRVDIVTSHAGCDGLLLRAAVGLGAQGVILEGTGNGTLTDRLDAVAREVMAQGVEVWRATRCIGGGVLDAAPTAGPCEVSADKALASAGDLTPAKARVELMLQLMERDPAPGWAAGSGALTW